MVGRVGVYRVRVKYGTLVAPECPGNTPLPTTSGDPLPSSAVQPSIEPGPKRFVYLRAGAVHCPRKESALDISPSLIYRVAYFRWIAEISNFPRKRYLHKNYFFSIYFKIVMTVQAFLVYFSTLSENNSD